MVARCRIAVGEPLMPPPAARLAEPRLATVVGLPAATDLVETVCRARLDRSAAGSTRPQPVCADGTGYL
jgi:hypothetical protein